MKQIILLLPLLLNANESFISYFDYGKMLYSSPRGISCAQCHGENGHGKVIVEYKDEDGNHAIKGADIREKSLLEITKSLNSKHMVMPRYYLTDEEAKAIHDYLQLMNNN